MPTEITWLGHSGFRIEAYDGTRILVDPWITGNPFCPVTLDDLSDVHAICLTHDHPHHVGEAVQIALRSGAVIVAPSPLTCRLLRDTPLEKQLVIHNGTGMNVGGTCRLGKVKTALVEAVHISAGGPGVGYVFTLEDSKRVYHAGDTGIFYGMKLLSKMFRPTLACLPVGGVYTMDAKQVTLAAQMMKLKRVWPMHFGTLPELAQDLDEVRATLSKHSPTTELIEQPPGAPYTLE